MVIAQTTNKLVRSSRMLRGYGIPAHISARALTRRMPDTVVVAHRSGYRISVDPHEYSGRVITLCGDYDGRIGELAARLARPDDTVLDIGALYGTEALAAAKAVPQGRVHAFEPQARYAQLIRDTVALNKIANVDVHQVALGDRDDEVVFSSAPNELGSANAGDVGMVTGDLAGERVRLVDTASYLAEVGITSVDVVKVDVQDYETTVLTNLLDGVAVLPRALIFESMNRVGAVSELFERSEIALLVNRGYRIGELQGSMFRLQVVECDRGRQPKHRRIDFVAVSPAVTTAELARIGWVATAART